jgi:hypothetical protein
MKMQLMPCPFCGSQNIDPEGWASTDRAGPACDDCAGTADTVELWNKRPIIGLSRLVIAARKVAFEDRSREAIRELDHASEVFASLIPWENEPKDTDNDRLINEHELMRKTLEVIAANSADRLQATQALGVLANIGPKVS